MVRVSGVISEFFKLGVWGYDLTHFQSLRNYFETRENDFALTVTSCAFLYHFDLLGLPSTVMHFPHSG